MKTTDNFKKTIAAHLDGVAATDPLFAETLKKPNKNIDDCIIYILNEVKKSGCNGFTDDEVFGMAIHYYDEDNLDVGKAINMNVVVNHQVQLTPEEIAAAKEKAFEKAVTEQKEKMVKKPVKKVAAPEQSQDSLFGEL